MNKGMTLIEATIAITGVSVLILATFFMINVISEYLIYNQNKNEEVMYYKELDLLFSNFVENYDNNTWYVYENSVVVNETEVLSINDLNLIIIFNDNNQQTFTLKLPLTLKYYNSNLFSFHFYHQDQLYEKMYYVGGTLIEGT